MDIFDKRIQPEEYQLWLQENDIGPHPEDPSRTLAAPLSSKRVILCNENNTSIPKLNIETGRKHQHVTHKLSISELFDDRTHENTAIDVPSSTSAQGFDEKEYEDELIDEQREVMEDIILLNSDEIDDQRPTLNTEITKYLDEAIVEQEYQEKETACQHGLDDSCSDNDLPEGWKQIDHDSGMPMYMNTELRVCSFTKPYFLGTNSLRNHEIPVANVPCLNQKLKNETNVASTSTSNRCPATLSHAEYRNYCSKIFKFKSVKFLKFDSWVKRREYLKQQKIDLKLKEFQGSTSTLSNSHSVDKSESNVSNPVDLQCIINFEGKSYIGILHEYIQRILRTSNPSFVFKELEQSKYPYLSIVLIDGIQYGIGTGSSKKKAKIDSARATLQILLPTVKHFQTDNTSQISNGIQENNYLEQYKIFDKLKIKDTRIPQICAQSTESTPYEMLKLCVKRNFGEGTNLLCEMEQMKSGSDTDNYYRCTMTVNKYTATVICKDKLDGRQKGAQALLKVLHPHVHYFGSLLRLYSHQRFEYNEKIPNKPIIKTKKYRNCPDLNLLQKLRTTMLELESQTHD